MSVTLAQAYETALQAIGDGMRITSASEGTGHWFFGVGDALVDEVPGSSPITIDKETGEDVYKRQVDNPPFSILSKIVAFYADHGIGFFLFAPTLTCMGIQRCSKVVAGAAVVYENGASVNTSFVTNLDPMLARSAPELRAAIDELSLIHI